MDYIPKQIQLKEYQRHVTTLLTQHQADMLREHVQKYITIRPAWDPNAWELEAKQYVGTIVLDNLQIVIQPKVPVHNLFYMLTYLYNLPTFRKEKSFLESSEEIFDFVVQLFLKEVEQLVRQGLHHNYLPQEKNSGYLRGRLLMAEQIRKNVVQSHRFYQRHDAYTADLLENRILNYTLCFLAAFAGTNSALRPQLRRVYVAFSELKQSPIHMADFESIVYTRLNQRYEPAINLAQLLLNHLSVEGRFGQTRFGSYLFDMNLLFERFVACYLERYFANHAHLSIDIQPTIWLDKERRERGRPDIVLQRQGQPDTVLDTKYKRFDRQPQEADRNQIFLYCHSLNVNQGILIYADDAPIAYQGQFPGMVLAAKSLSLAGSLNEFRQRCESFANQLEHRIREI